MPLSDAYVEGTYFCVTPEGKKVAKLPDWCIPAPGSMIKIKGAWHTVCGVRNHERTCIVRKCWAPKEMLNDYANRK